ncbi:photosystem I reaction center subunit PsaK [Gloeomargarita lithophora Alchichica-D10]|uniref:Photosystem I reaction center subunit PsaK n=1 Tax=Gloeomargarita lithophora Alchichica-D10 TaxID=1188229 RepID=A0A1J0AFT6_9CYAN|nr:photosystem I reaction center subunit PsaK [Gloeomargarita lithophora]APB34801.1 photosystem I reaction center subunit PsaK [Gloeomargarita lithophora Alchichica-D10]
MNPLLLTVPTTVPWSSSVALVMIGCNLFAVAIGYYAIQAKGVGPALPLPELFKGFGLPELLGTAALGHVLGAGMVLGLANSGLL